MQIDAAISEIQQFDTKRVISVIDGAHGVLLCESAKYDCSHFVSSNEGKWVKFRPHFGIVGKHIPDFLLPVH